MKHLISNMAFHSLALLTMILLVACDGAVSVGGNEVNETSVPAAVPSNGLTFSSGEQSQTQPLTGLDQHLTRLNDSTLAKLQENIFSPLCATCHSGGGEELPASMDFSTADATFASLINADSTEYPQLVLVAPGMSTNSYLVRKLEGTQLVGDQMPRGGTPLGSEQIIEIKAWIDAGAVR